jgi:hypothetical protein
MQNLYEVARMAPESFLVIDVPASAVVASGLPLLRRSLGTSLQLYRAHVGYYRYEDVRTQ